MAQAGTVWVDVRGDTSALHRDIAAVAVAAGAVTIGAFGAQAVREATEFNKAVSGVGAVANASAADLEAFRQAALKAGADTAYSASEAAQAEAELAKAGLSTADVLGGGLAGALDLAAAGQIGLTDAATYTAQALNVFSLEGSDASRVADVLAAGAVKSAADVSQLGQALQQGGLVAKQTGLTLEDTVGVLSLFADNALIGSDAGTSLKTMLQRLVPQSEEAAAAMETLGLSFFDSQGRFVGIEETAGRLQSALSNLSTEQRQSALTQIFGADAIRAASLLYEGGADKVREYTDAVNDQGAAQRVASQQLDNLAGDVEALKGSYETLLIGLGSSADSGLRDIVQAATDVVNELGAFAQSPVFDEITGQIGAALASIAEDIGSIGDRLNSALSDVDPSDVEGFFGAIRDAVDGIEGPIAGIGLALSTMAAGALPAIDRLIPGISPLQGVLAGLVLQSEEGRDALASIGEIAVDIGQAATPILGTLADVLGFVADQGDLVKFAFDAFVAYKIVQTVTPWIGSVTQLGQSFVTLGQQINSIAATRGVSQLEALRGVIGASGTGLVGSLGAASIATAGLTGAIAGGLYVYQEWADANREATDATNEFSEALRAQDAELSVKALRDNLKRLDLSGEFDRIGLSAKRVYSEIAASPGDIDKFRAAFQKFNEDFRYLEESADEAGVKVPRSIQQIFDAVDADLISEDVGRRLINALTDIDKGAALTAGQVATDFNSIRAELRRTTDVSQETVDAIVAEWRGLSIEDQPAFLDDLISRFPEVADAAGVAAADTADVVASTGSNLSKFADVTDEVAASAEGMSGRIAEAAGAFTSVGDAAESAASQVLDLLDAQDSVDDANRRVADAEAKLTDIINQNTEAVRNARVTVSEARRELNEALADTGPGSRAARDALSEVRQAMRSLRELQIEAGKTSPGDWIEDRTADIEDAFLKVVDAQTKYGDVVSGNTDQVRNARDQLADAEGKLNEELAKTGPTSREAADATEELDDAKRNAARTNEDYKATLDDISDDAIPGMITGLQDLADQYGLSTPEVDKMSAALLNELALRQELNRTPIVPAESPPTKPRPNNRDTVNVANPGTTNRELTVTQGRLIGLSPPDNGKPADLVDNLGQSWVWDVNRRRWTRLGPGRARGGPVWADAMFPIVENGEPEVFESKSGDRYLLPSEAGRVVPLTPDALDPGTKGRPSFVHSGDREHAVMPAQDGTREHAVMPMDALTAEVRALRGELVSTVRYLARTVTPGAGEELAPVLREIERNTRNAQTGDTPAAVRSKAMANV